jgi:hypothetical protein
MSCSWIGKFTSSRDGMAFTFPLAGGGIELDPTRGGAALGVFDGIGHELEFGGALGERDLVAEAHLERGDVDLLAVHAHMAVTDELTRLGAGGGEAHAEHRGVEATLEKNEQGLAHDALLHGGAVEGAAELIVRAGRRYA